MNAANSPKNIEFERSTTSLKKLHRFNTFILVGFVIIHLLTHISGVFGIDAYNHTQSLFRTIYRQPIIEPILLVSLSSQLIVGVILLTKSVRIGRPASLWGWAQVISGGLFFLFMLQHLYSLGMTRLYFDLDTNFYWPASVMASAPWTYYFTPYYFIGVWAVISHVGLGLRFILLDRGHRKAGNYLAIVCMLFGAIIAALIDAILLGAFFDIQLPQEWIDYIRFYDKDFAP